MNELIFKIQQHYPKLTPSSRKIADYLYEHGADAQYFSISQLAEACGVAEATIFRFCRSLDFGGYNDFKLALAKSLVDTSKPYAAYSENCDNNSVEGMAHRLYVANREALDETLIRLDPSAITRAADLLKQAGRVLCAGSGSSMVSAMEAWSRFSCISGKFQIIQDYHSQIMSASLLEPNDVVLYISFSGSTKDALDVLRPARKRGAKVIVITYYAQSAITNFADVVLLCGGQEAPVHSGGIAARVALLFEIDLLVNEFSRHNKDSILHNKDLTSAALNCRRL